MLERRKAPRYRVQLPVLWSWSDGQKTQTQGGFTRDVSSKGFFVICSGTPPVCTPLDLKVLLPTSGYASESAIRASGHVARIAGRGEGRGLAIAAEISIDDGRAANGI